MERTRVSFSASHFLSILFVIVEACRHGSLHIDRIEIKIKKPFFGFFVFVFCDFCDFFNVSSVCDFLIFRRFVIF